MDATSPATLFAIWERGRRLAPTSRSRVMLRALGFDDAALGTLTVGQRDAILMDLRARIFGASVSSVVDCPACGDRLDISFGLGDVWAPPPNDPTHPVAIEHEEYAVVARPPQLDDLLWLEQSGAGPDPRTALLERCVTDARYKGEPVDATTLPDAVVDRVSSALAEADPQADVHLALACATCGHAWMALFDIVPFFWHELEMWVWRMAREVDTLAARYGWSEAEILAMSQDRRTLYLEVART